MSNDLLNNLAGEGALAARGEFQLDREKAREKMEQFQLVDPYMYVLELVQGAHMLGATWINFTVDSDELRMEFDGAGLKRDELEDVYGAAFSRDPDERVQARRHFAIALTAAGALNAAEIRLTMKHGNGGAELLIRGDKEEVSEVAGSDRNVFYMKEKFRMGHIVEFFSHYDGSFREAKLVEERCQYADTTITINGRRVSKGLHLPSEAKHATRLQHEKDRGILGLTNWDLSAASVQSEVRLLQNGVWIQSLHFGSDNLGFFAVYESPRLTKNLSQSAFVEDDVLIEIVEGRLPEAMYESMVPWVEQIRVTGSTYGALRSIATQTWRRQLAQKLDSNSTTGRLAKVMETLPVWPSATAVTGSDVLVFGASQMVPARRFLQGPPNGKAYFATRRYHGLEFDKPVFLNRSDTIDAFRVLIEYSRKDWDDLTADLDARQEGARNKLRWQKRPWTAPPKTLHKHRVEFEVHGFRVELYSVSDRKQGLVLVHVHDGNVLNSGRVPEQIPAAQVVIHGKFEVNTTWDAPLRSKAIEEVYRAVIDSLPQLWFEVARDPQPNANAQYQITMAALQFSTGTYLNFALKAFGFAEETVTNEAVAAMNDEESPLYIRMGSGSYMAKFGDRAERIQTRLQGLNSLGTARVIPTSAGMTTLAKLAEHPASSQGAWTANLGALERHGQALNAWRRGPIVSEEYPYGYLIDAVFEDTTDAIYHLEREGARIQYMGREAKDHARIFDLPRYVLKGELTGKTDGRVWSARWGARRGSMMTSGSLTALHAQRELERRMFEHSFSTVDVVVWGEAVEPNKTYTGAKSTDWLPDLNAAVNDQLRSMVEAFCAELHDPDAPVIETGERVFLWELISNAFVRENPVANLPFARDTQGRTYSARQLAELAGESQLFWVIEGQPFLEDLVSGGAPIVELPSEEVVPFLETICGRGSMRDVTVTPDRSRQVKESRARFYAQEQRLLDVPYAMAKATDEEDGLTVVAALLAVEPEVGSLSTLIVCRERREVAREHMRLPFGRFEIVVNGENLRLDADWRRPTNMVASRNLALSASEKVVCEYLKNAQEESTRNATVRERVISWARTAISDPDTEWRWPTAWGLLHDIPIWRTSNGEWLSIQGAWATADYGPLRFAGPSDRVHSTEPYIVATGGGLLLLRELFDDELVFLGQSVGRHMAIPDDEGEASAQLARDEEDVVPVWEIDVEEAVQAKEAHRQEDPNELLLEGLREMIRDVSAGARGALEAKYTDELKLWGNDPKRVARVASDQVTLMTDHVLTTYALGDKDDPIRRAFLASAVMTVINHHYEEVGDEDEEKLQAQLLRHMNRALEA